MKTLNLKPLSVNEVWKGRRFKTDRYKGYESLVFWNLPNIKVSSGRLAVKILFGFSSPNADVDNCAKPFIDILQKKYKFNDKNIYDLRLSKVDVKKGDEFISFEINPIEKVQQDLFSLADEQKYN